MKSVMGGNALRIRGIAIMCVAGLLAACGTSNASTTGPVTLNFYLYPDSSGATHGLFFVPPNKFFTFDYPGSTFTSLNGISSQGNICGRYVDASGIAHGFIARAKGIPSANQAGMLVTPLNPSSPVTPLNPSPATWGDAMPAR